MNLTEKSAYIKGLAEGLELDNSTKEGKVILALLGLVEEMAETIDEMQAKMSDLEDYCEELDEDLGDVEEVLLDLDDEDDDFDACDGDCDNCCLDCDLDDEDEDDDEYFEIVCPACGDIVCFDSTIDPEELKCPACGEKFECIVDEDDLKALDGSDEE